MAKPKSSDIHCSRNPLSELAYSLTKFETDDNTAP